MGEAKHTPGPWYTRRGDSVVHVMAGSICLTATCTKSYYEHFDDEDLANATLIAAAPDLLAALQAAVAGWDERLEDGDPYPDWLAPARAAIAKALGTSARSSQEGAR